MSTRMNELATTLANMEALLVVAPAQIRSEIEEQIAWARETLLLFDSEKPTTHAPAQWIGDEKRFLEARTSAELLGWPLPPHAQ